MGLSFQAETGEKELSGEKVLKELAKDPIKFLYSRRDIGYLSEVEKKALRLTAGLEEKLESIFKDLKGTFGFISNPVQIIIGIAFGNFNYRTGYLTQFNKDVDFLYLRNQGKYDFNLSQPTLNFTQLIKNLIQELTQKLPGRNKKRT